MPLATFTDWYGQQRTFTEFDEFLSVKVCTYPFISKVPIGNDRLVLTFQHFYQIQNLYRKVNRQCTQFAFWHNDILLP